MSQLQVNHHVLVHTLALLARKLSLVLHYQRMDALIAKQEPIKTLLLTQNQYAHLAPLEPFPPPQVNHLALEHTLVKLVNMLSLVLHQLHWLTQLCVQPAQQARFLHLVALKALSAFLAASESTGPAQLVLIVLLDSIRA